MKAFDAKCERLGWRCQICGKELTRETATVDHIVPCKYGGTNEIDNLQPLCMKCNVKKGVKPMKAMLGSEFLFE
jgi:5-methylcytosine-specific restriction endonuclease McrA